MLFQMANAVIADIKLLVFGDNMKKITRRSFLKGFSFFIGSLALPFTGSKKMHLTDENKSKKLSSREASFYKRLAG